MPSSIEGFLEFTRPVNSKKTHMPFSVRQPEGGENASSSAAARRNTPGHLRRSDSGNLKKECFNNHGEA